MPGTITPTRMELMRQRTRLQTARRGHKLLKDRRDEWMRRFLEEVQRAQRLRGALQKDWRLACAALETAAAALPPEALAAALLPVGLPLSVSVEARRIMGVETVCVQQEETEEPRPFPFGCAGTDGALDEAFARFSALLPRLLELAAAESTVLRMAREIESVRRRVNALECVLIPEAEETIRRVSMKLEENERGNIVRLMKVKDMVLDQARRSHIKKA